MCKLLLYQVRIISALYHFSIFHVHKKSDAFYLINMCRFWFIISWQSRKYSMYFTYAQKVGLLQVGRAFQDSPRVLMNPAPSVSHKSSHTSHHQIFLIFCIKLGHTLRSWLRFFLIQGEKYPFLEQARSIKINLICYYKPFGNTVKLFSMQNHARKPNFAFLLLTCIGIIYWKIG